jgi:hypothetical protein
MSSTQPRAALAPIVSELPMSMSRRTVTVAQGYDLEVGSVLGKETATGNYAPFDPNATDGTESAAAVTLYPVNTLVNEVGAVVIDKSATLNAAELEWYGATSEEIAAACEHLRETSGILIE